MFKVVSYGNDNPFRILGDCDRIDIPSWEWAGFPLWKELKYTEAIVVGRYNCDITRPTKLFLKGNAVTTIRGAEKLVNISYVQASGCGFTEIPHWIQRLPRLSDVYLNDNDLTEIPNWMRHLPMLKYINLDNNDLTEIPDWFMAITTLERAYFINNSRLRSLTAVSTTLKVISLEYCDIQSLPNDFFHHKLERVSLDYNKGRTL